jgi:hypothetical protein
VRATLTGWQTPLIAPTGADFQRAPVHEGGAHLDFALVVQDGAVAGIEDRKRFEHADRCLDCVDGCPASLEYRLPGCKRLQAARAILLFFLGRNFLGAAMDNQRPAAVLVRQITSSQAIRPPPSARRFDVAVSTLSNECDQLPGIVTSVE